MTNNKILYLEDHDDTREMMKLILEQAGFAVTTADLGAECLRLFDESPDYDLLLLDHTFKDASGVSICMAIREKDTQIPILFYSTRAFPKEREEAIKAGANGYLVKPVDLLHVADHVKRLIDENKEVVLTTSG